MAKLNMTKLNMAKVNMLFKKGYLLAEVIIAANMFVGNEVKASDNNDNMSIDDKTEQQADEKKEKERDKNASSLESVLNFVLSRENTINLIGGVVFSGANNYLKLWDYNAGSYCNLRIGCLGWRTKKFFDIVQLDFNLNLWRGIGWSIPHFIKFRRSLTKTGKTELEDSKESIKENEEENVGKGGSNADSLVSFLFKDILRGFISIPLTIHISNFSISISLDSMLWEFVIDKKFFKNKQVETVVKPPVIQNYKEPSQIYDFSTTTKIWLKTDESGYVDKYQNVIATIINTQNWSISHQLTSSQRINSAVLLDYQQAKDNFFPFLSKK